MYIELNDKAVSKSKVLGNGLVVIDIAEDGTVVGVELISPSLYVNQPEDIIVVQDDERKPVTRSTTL